MDFTERLDLYLEGGMIDEKDVKDVNAVIQIFQEKYGITLCEENAATFIAHLCAAYGRNTTHEEVEPLMEELFAEVKELDSYPQAEKMLQDLMSVTVNPLSMAELEYALLHINNLLASLNDSE